MAQGAATGTGELVKLEMQEIPMDFYLDPRCQKMSVFDVSHNALQSISKVPRNPKTPSNHWLDLFRPHVHRTA